MRGRVNKILASLQLGQTINILSGILAYFLGSKSLLDAGKLSGMKQTDLIAIFIRLNAFKC